MRTTTRCGSRVSKRNQLLPCPRLPRCRIVAVVFLARDSRRQRTRKAGQLDDAGSATRAVGKVILILEASGGRKDPEHAGRVPAPKGVPRICLREGKHRVHLIHVSVARRTVVTPAKDRATTKIDSSNWLATPQTPTGCKLGPTPGAWGFR